MSDWTDTIDGLIDHVTLLKELGQRTVEIDPSVLAAISAKPPRNAPAPAAAPASTAPGPAVAETPARPPANRRAALDEIAARIAACDACPLRQNRTHPVPGQGNPDTPDVMFIGEAPGADEDRQGLAFVGAAGQLLTKMIAAMGYSRDEVFIANICKCRPPGNRTPTAEEMRTCIPFLREQIKIIRPKTIVLLGGTAIKGVLETQVGVSRMQGQWTQYENIPVMPTFHPAYILRFESAGDAAGLKRAKTEVWNALKLVLKQLGKPVPGPASAPAKG